MKTKKFIVPILLMAILALGVVAACLPIWQHNAAADGTATLQSEYAVGSEVTIPDMHFDSGGTQVRANKIVYYPDGRAFASDVITPDIMGLYRVVYSANTTSGFKSETKEFYAYRNLFETQGLNSSTEYGAHSLTPNNSGLMVSLSGTGTFLYNGVFDMSNLTLADKLVSFYITPEVPGEMDMHTIRIVFTDVYDSSKYLTMIITGSYDGIGHGVSYIQVGAQNQPTTGLEANQNKIHRNNRYGFPMNFSMYGSNAFGVSNESFLVNNNVELYLNYANREMHAKRNSQGHSLIIDLDAPEYFDDPWEGFTTGEATMSVTVENMYKSSGNLVFTEICGQDFTENKLIDRLKPTVTVDSEGYDVLPDAVVGNPYPLFSATAIDQYSGVTAVRRNVYENYGSPSQIEHNVVDGYFTPVSPGKYYIVYSAVDYSGNEGAVVYEINCTSSGTPIVFSVSGEREDAGSVGAWIDIAEHTVSGGNGRVTVDIKVTDPSNRAVEVVNGRFKPLTAGTYVVDYIASDFVSQRETFTYTVEASVSNSPVYDFVPVLPKYFIAGYEYEFPTLYAYDYRANGAAVRATLSITDDAGTTTLGPDNKGKFTITASGGKRDVTLTYSATGSNGTGTCSFTVPAINVQRHDVTLNEEVLDMSRYFISEDVTATPSASDIKLSTSTNSSVEYAVPLVTDGFAAIFDALAAESNFTALTIWLTDSENPSLKVKGTFTKTATIATFRVNDTGLVYTTDSTFTGSVREFRFGYRLADNRIAINDSTYIAVSNYYGSDAAFEGFPSGKFYFEIEFENVTGASSINLRSLNSQPMSNAIMDRVRPKISIIGETGGTKPINSVIAVPRAVAGDVLVPYVTSTVTVVAPDNTNPVSADGIVLKNVTADRAYEFTATMYGDYRIEYTSSDGNATPITIPRVVSIDDTDAPVITLARANVTTAKVGDTVVIASASATDNYTAVENVIVRAYLILPDGRIMAISGNSFVVTEAGEYTIIYMARDEAGNFATVENIIVATAA